MDLSTMVSLMMINGLLMRKRRTQIHTKMQTTN